MKKFIIEGISDAGSKNLENQDACFAGTTAAVTGDVVFAIVCDGMGGMQSGDLASASIIDEFRKWFYCKCDLGSEWSADIFETHNEWEEILERCNQEIIKYGTEHSTKLGSTIIAVLFTQDSVMLMNVGDSRAYYVADTVKKLSYDHSVVGKDIELGILTEEEAKNDTRNNVLTQCVGILDEIDPFFSSFEICNGCYVLCSDGFYNKISNKEIQNMLSNASDNEALRDAVTTLVSIDREREEKDDISVITVIVYED